MKKKRWLSATLLVALVGGLVHHASLHVSTGPAEGNSILGETAATPHRRPAIRIGTFNIHGGKGRDGRRDLARVAGCLEGLDFVGLNEVHGPRLWQQHDQAQRLGRALGMGWLFAPAVRTWYHMESGNGLLSSVPVAFWQRIPLSQRYDHSHRNAVLAGIKLQGRELHVLISHVARRHDPERHAQLRAVIALFLALAEPAILLGDMNSTTEDPQILQLLQTPGVFDPAGEFLGPEVMREKAPRRIDWIFARGLRCVDAGIVDKGASDHPLVWVELELRPRMVASSRSGSLRLRAFRQTANADHTGFRQP